MFVGLVHSINGDNAAGVGGLISTVIDGVIKQTHRHRCSQQVRGRGGHELKITCFVPPLVDELPTSCGFIHFAPAI